MAIWIQNGVVVTPQGAVETDVCIQDGKIQALCNKPQDAAGETIDAAGCYVFPGFIDTHTHFDLNLGVTVTADNFITGTKAAVLGGTTCVLDFATQDRGMSMQDALDLWHKKAQGSSCNYGFHMAVSEWNDERIAEIDPMVAQGVTSFKMYMVYDAMRVTDGEIYSALKLTAARNCVVGVHCENFDVLNARILELHAAGVYGPEGHPMARPSAVEAEGVARLMRIAQLADAPAWVVHLSTKEGLEEAQRARARGQEIYLETCPQYLVLDDSCFNQPDGEKFIMSPPPRKPADSEALLTAMGQGDIDVVGTDHCSFTMAQKALGNGDFAKVPNGGAGVQNRAQLIYTYAVDTGRITLSQMAEMLSQTPAKLFGMYPKKGAIQVGSDGDVTIYDPRGESTISYRTNAHNCDNSPYEGFPVKGNVRHVLLNGEVVVRDGKLIKPGKGKYVFRGPSQRPRR